MRDAEDAIEDLTEDSTPQEIADAYQDLVFAQTNLSSVTEGIIRAAEETGRITGTAATNAIRTLGSDLGDDIRTANTALISTLGDVGFEVIGGIENMREAIDVSDISSVFRMIPAEVEEAAEAEPEPEPEPEPAALQSTFRFTGDQRGILAPLQGEVTAAQDFINNFLTEDSSPEEIRDAYATLTDAESALFNQKVQFILLATDITDEARGRALTVEGQIFDREIRDANDDLVDAFEEIGLQLVNALTFTSGVLRGTAIATQQIPAEVEAAAAEPEAEAEAEVDPDDPLAPLRSNIRLAANQVRRARTGLGQATSEEDFEARRVNLIQAANVEFAAQIALLDALGLSATDYQDKFEDAEDSRDAIITRATTATNTFTETRIKGEEDAATAAQTAADEIIKIADMERDAKIRAAMDYNDAVSELNQDRIDTEMRAADALVDLEQDTQDRITDIIRDANRSKEDIERDFQRDFQDITRERTEAQNEVIRQRNEGTITSAEADERFEALARESASQLSDLGRERVRDLQDAGIREGRRFEDADIRQQRGERDISSESSERLIGIQQETAALESETAAIASTTAVSNATAAMVSTDASVQSIEAAMGLGTAGDNLDMAAVELQSAARVQGLFEAASAVKGAAGELSMAAEEFRASTRGLALLIGAFLSTFDSVNTALDAGTLAFASTTQMALAAPEEVSMPVEIANTDDIYDPARIAELQAQGVNSGEIGRILRGEIPAPAATDMLLESTAPEALMQPAPPMAEMIVNSVSITAGSVSVTGQTGAIDAKITNPEDIQTNVNVNPVITS